MKKSEEEAILESSCFARQRFCAAIFTKILHAKKVGDTRRALACVAGGIRGHERTGRGERCRREHCRGFRGRMNPESLKCHFLDFGGRFCGILMVRKHLLIKQDACSDVHTGLAAINQSINTNLFKHCKIFSTCII
jgi:hypothetical protein